MSLDDLERGDEEPSERGPRRHRRHLRVRSRRHARHRSRRQQRHPRPSSRQPGPLRYIAPKNSCLAEILSSEPIRWYASRMLQEAPL